MKQKLLVVALISVILLAQRTLGQQVMDRVVAIVNGVPILQSDWETQVRYEAFVAQRPPSETDRQAALQRVIDQELLRQQMKGTDGETPAKQVEEQLEQVRQQTPNARTAEGWRRALAEYGLTTSDLWERIEAQAKLLGFVNRRLRPSVHVSQKEVEDYYRETFLPELRKRGGGEQPLEEVSAKIEEVLMQKEINLELNNWLKELRRQGAVRMMAAVEENSAQP